MLGTLPLDCASVSDAHGRMHRPSNASSNSDAVASASRGIETIVATTSAAAGSASAQRDAGAHALIRGRHKARGERQQAERESERDELDHGQAKLAPAMSAFARRRGVGAIDTAGECRHDQRWRSALR